MTRPASLGVFDGDGDLIVSAVARLGEQFDELSESIGVIGDAFPRVEVAVAIHDGDVVVGFGPIDSTE